MTTPAGDPGPGTLAGAAQVARASVKTVPVAASALVTPPGHLHASDWSPKPQDFPTVHLPHLVFSSKHEPETEVERALKAHDASTSHHDQLRYIRKTWRVTAKDAGKQALVALEKNKQAFADAIGPDHCKLAADGIAPLTEAAPGPHTSAMARQPPSSPKIALLDFLMPDKQPPRKGEALYAPLVTCDGTPKPPLAAIFSQLQKETSPLRHIVNGSMREGGVTVEDVRRTCMEGVQMGSQKKPGVFMALCQGEIRVGVALSCEKTIKLLFGGEAGHGCHEDVADFVRRHENHPSLKIALVYTPPSDAPWSIMPVVQTVVKVLIKNVATLHKNDPTAIALNDIHTPMLVRHFRWCWLTLYRHLLIKFDGKSEGVMGAPEIGKVVDGIATPMQLDKQQASIAFCANLWRSAVADSGQTDEEFVLCFWYLYHNRSKFPFVVALHDRYTFPSKSFSNINFHWYEYDALSIQIKRDIQLADPSLGKEAAQAQAERARSKVFQLQAAFWLDMLQRRQTGPDRLVAQEHKVPVNLLDGTDDHDEDVMEAEGRARHEDAMMRRAEADWSDSSD